MHLVGFSLFTLKQTFIMFIIALGQHVSILTESSSGPSKKIDTSLEMFKMRCGIPNAYILDIIMYKMYVSLCSQRILTFLSKELFS